MVAMAEAPWALMAQDWASKAGHTISTSSGRWSLIPASVLGTSSLQVSFQSLISASDCGSAVLNSHHGILHKLNVVLSAGPFLYVMHREGTGDEAAQNEDSNRHSMGQLAKCRYREAGKECITGSVIICQYYIPSSLAFPCIARKTRGRISEATFLAESGECRAIAWKVWAMPDLLEPSTESKEHGHTHCLSL